MRRAYGMTLLELLIALSIFSLVSLASFRILSSIMTVQSVSNDHSNQLGQYQKVANQLDRDFSQFINRGVRVSLDQTERALELNKDGFAVSFTRGGLGNPLALQRSQLQRTAYDLGPHPSSTNKKSRFYNSEDLYLRRHSWSQLDRVDSTGHIRALLAKVEAFEVTVITPKGLYKQWPIKDQDEEDLIGFELSLVVEGMSPLKRIYRVN